MKQSLPTNATMAQSKTTQQMQQNLPSRRSSKAATLWLLLLIGIPAIPGLFIMVVVMMGPTTSEELSTMINPAYFEKPLTIMLHAGSSLLFFLTVPFQFSQGLRTQRPKLHKQSGYLALLSGSIMTVSGVLMHYVFNGHLFDARFYALSLQSVLMLFAYGMAIATVLNKNIASHQRWMARAIAIALSLVSLLFVELGFLLTLGQQVAQNNTALVDTLHTYGNLMGMVINLIVVEYLFSKKKNQTPMTAASFSHRKHIKTQNTCE